MESRQTPNAWRKSKNIHMSQREKVSTESTVSNFGRGARVWFTNLKCTHLSMLLQKKLRTSSLNFLSMKRNGKRVVYMRS